MATGRSRDVSERLNLHSKCTIRVVDKSVDDSEETKEFIASVFQPEQPHCQRSSSLSLSRLSSHIDTALDLALLDYTESKQPVEELKNYGRLGPESVMFNYSGCAGIIIVEADRLGVTGSSNFSTIRTNVCVYAGKWIYEVLLGSKGVMQIGWCTLKCRFSAEDGVGDTVDSYAYDGSRVCKWNAKVHRKYGESWLSGDIITVAIDCDAGTVTFLRNGQNLGEAFTDVRVGQGFAYFPAVSLSIHENVRANFGSTPLHYTLPGYRPVQAPPTIDLIRSHLLLGYFERLVPIMASCCAPKASESHVVRTKHELQSVLSLPVRRKTTLYILASHIMNHLAPSLLNAYVVEECLFTLMVRFDNDLKCLHQLLDVLLALLQDNELKMCMEHLAICLLTQYRFSVVNGEFTLQKKYLSLLQSILRHERMRKYLLRHVLFDKIRFPMFMHIKAPDENVLAQLIPEVWWDAKGGILAEEDLDSQVVYSDADIERRNKFLASCRELREKVSAVESIQIDILITMLTSDDITSEDLVSSRSIFVQKFRAFLHEHHTPSHIRLQQVNQCPLFVQLCLFNRLVRALQYHLQIAQSELHNSEINVNYKLFCDRSVEYWDVPRLGGVASYLYKTHEKLLNEKLGERQTVADESSEMALLVDGLILLYHMSAHKQLGKMYTLKEASTEYVAALEETVKKLSSCPTELWTVHSQLQSSREIFTKKTTEQSRHLAWVNAAIISMEKRDDVEWLFRCMLTTLKDAMHNAGPLFALVPEFYVEACISAYSALKSYFTPSLLSLQSPAHLELLAAYAEFVCTSFCDSRIVSTDVRDTMIQALGLVVCYPASLTALHSVNLDSRLALMRSLLSPYENRPWAQTNWILVQMWKGCGFAYRYTCLPHMAKAKNKQQDVGISGTRKPCPSAVFQNHLREYLESDSEAASKLIDTMLNQLNWSFSEFVRVLQELEQVIVRPGGLRNQLDGRQLKICSTCFDIAVGLLRVIEMIVSVYPQVFVAGVTQHSELLLHRLLQMLAQVLNRICHPENTFNRIVVLRLPGLDSVDPFPILGAVTGILVQLVNSGSKARQQHVVAALMSDPGFQLSCVDYLLGYSSSAAAAMPHHDDGSFSFVSYDEVNDAEKQQLQQLIDTLHAHVHKNDAQEVPEDLLCNICYARVKSVIFLPCHHQSCRACIEHQMMSRNECFFCKAQIDEVVDTKPDAGVKL